jgi:hypothetical protein
VNLGDVLKRAQKLTIDNSPAILTGVAVAGTVMTAYLTGTATLKAAEVLKNEENRFESNHPDYAIDPLDLKEKVALTWKLYIPPVTTGLLTVTCIIGANRIGTRRAAAVAAAYTLSEKAFSEYRDKVVEKLGEKKEQAVRDELAQDRVNRNPANSSQLVVIDGRSVLCYEAFTGRFFLSDMETLRKAENDTNHQVNNDYYAALTDFYDRIGLDKTSMSDEVGWNCNKLLEVQYSTTLAPDGRPCISIDYAVAPIRDFYRVQ